MQVRKTVNPYFDRALATLQAYHPLFEIGGLPALDLSKRPQGIRSNAAWEGYVGALLTAQAIGQREGWVRMHQNRRGHLLFMALDIPEDGHSQRRGRRP